MYAAKHVTTTNRVHTAATGMQDHLVPEACHIVSQQIKQLGTVCVAVHRPSMPLQLRLHLPQARFAALVTCLCSFQLLLLGLRGSNEACA
jgi:hypothetical protein